MDAMQIFTALGTPDGRADPYPHFAALHELGEAVTLAPGSVAVVGYDAISSVLRDPGFLVSDEAELDRTYPGWRENPVLVQGMDWILNLNGSKHARIRSLIARAFTARRVAALEPAIARMAGDLIDAMAERGADGSPVEFMHDFAYLLPVTVICELIGIPEADRESFRPVARDIAGIFEMDDPARLPVINAAAAELLAYFTGLAAHRRARPCDDLISSLLAISDSGDGRLNRRRAAAQPDSAAGGRFRDNHQPARERARDPPPRASGRGRPPGWLRPARRVRRGGAALRLAGAADLAGGLRHQDRGDSDR